MVSGAWHGEVLLPKCPHWRIRSFSRLHLASSTRSIIASFSVLCAADLPSASELELASVTGDMVDLALGAVLQREFIEPVPGRYPRFKDPGLEGSAHGSVLNRRHPHKFLAQLLSLARSPSSASSIPVPSRLERSDFGNRSKAGVAGAL